MTKQELASRIWSMANKMRTKIKANEYKDYILGFMFYKFLSDKELDYLKRFVDSTEELKDMGDYAMELVKDHLGYAISYDNLFSSLKAQGINLTAKTVSEAIDEFNKNINPSQKMVFNHIFDTLQNGISKMGDSSGSRDKAVRDIMDMIDKIPSSKASGYDVLGYVYEFLIYKFATAAKDDGAFYTPHEVSKLISLIVAEICKDKKELKVYDPTSGSGSLLRTIGEEAARYIDEANIKYYGQEKITETYHLTRMNLVMKGVPSQNIIVRNGDTLEDDWPYFDENTAYQPLRVNAVVSNPPYSLKWDPESRTNDDRFRGYGIAPSGKADYAFLLHCLYHMEGDGIMAIVLPHGVLFRGDSEEDIRKNLCAKHNIETIIGLPENLFFATSIPTIIMILRKERTADDILFIDASQYYEKGKNQNMLRDSDLKRIFDAVKARRDIDGYAHLASYEELKANDFNLNITRYVKSDDIGDNIDFAALMNGTVPDEELDMYGDTWNAFPSLRDMLFERRGDGYSNFCDVNTKNTIEGNSDVAQFRNTFDSKVENFKEYLKNLIIRDDYCLSKGEVKDIQDRITGTVFDMVKDMNIISGYDAYQHFINGWNTITTDIDIFVNNGGLLDVAKQIEPNMVLKKSGKEEVEIQDGFKGTILPFDLVGEVMFTAEYEEVKNCENEISGLESDCSTVFDSLDEDVKAAVGDGEKFKEAELKKYLKENPDEELQRALDNIVRTKTLRKQIKDKQSDILNRIQQKITTLDDDEVKTLLFIKWIKPICKNLSSMTDNVISTLTRNMDALRVKYSDTLSSIESDISAAQNSLTSLLSELTGSTIDLAAVKSLKGVLE